jgi:hypothetical protein
MVRKKRMSGIAARMMLINLYMASLPKSFFGRPIPRGLVRAGSRITTRTNRPIAKAQSLLATTSQWRIHSRSCASRQGALEVAAAHTAPATWLSKWSVRWDRGRLGELAMCRPLTRGILKRYGTRITSFSTDLMRCTSSTTEQGWPFLQLALWSLVGEFAEQSMRLAVAVDVLNSQKGVWL